MTAKGAARNKVSRLLSESSMEHLDRISKDWGLASNEKGEIAQNPNLGETKRES